MAVNPVSTAFQNLINALKGDVLSIAKPILLALSTNIKTNPDPQNAAAQFMIAEATLALSGPTLEKEAIAQAADALAVFANTLP